MNGMKPIHVKKGYTMTRLTKDDAPELTPELVKGARKYSEASPLAQAVNRGRPKAENPKVPVSVRLDADIVAHFKASGKGWQTRLNETLKKAVFE